jgi:chemotaxis protein methyltransferase CheR
VSAPPPAAAPDLGAELAPLDDRSFARFRALIHREAGIALADGKRALLVSRLGRRLRDLGVPSFAAYFELVLADPAELVRMLDAVCTNETQFFREPRKFELLAGPLCDAWLAEANAGRRPRRARVWSAACSTGEEPYSLAMVLLDRLAPAGWTVEIMATDLSTRALAHARRGIWRLDRTAGIPVRLRDTWFLAGTGPQAGNAKAGPELRDVVRFARVNLADPDAWPPGDPFDAVFCRNVLIYFDRATRVRTLSALARRIAPGGWLFLGHAESLTGTGLGLTSVMPAVYRQPEAA